MAVFASSPSLLAQPSDGVDEGTTGQSRSIAITVSGGQITRIELGWTCGGASATTTMSLSCPITSNSFSCGNATCTPASTPVGFELTVTDTKNGVTRTYTNPDQTTAATVTDPMAFATCP